MNTPLTELSELAEELIQVAVATRGRARRRLARLYQDLDTRIRGIEATLDEALETVVPLDPTKHPVLRAARVLVALRTVVEHLRRLPRLSGEAGEAVWEAAGPHLEELGELARALLSEAVTAALEEDEDRREAVRLAAGEVTALFDAALAGLVAVVLACEDHAATALKAQRLLHALEAVADTAAALARPDGDPARVPRRQPELLHAADQTELPGAQRALGLGT